MAERKGQEIAAAWLKSEKFGFPIQDRSEAEDVDIVLRFDPVFVSNRSKYLGNLQANPELLSALQELYRVHKSNLEGQVSLVCTQSVSDVAPHDDREGQEIENVGQLNQKQSFRDHLEPCVKEKATVHPSKQLGCKRPNPASFEEDRRAFFIVWTRFLKNKLLTWYMCTWAYSLRFSILLNLGMINGFLAIIWARLLGLCFFLLLFLARSEMSHFSKIMSHGLRIEHALLLGNSFLSWSQKHHRCFFVGEKRW